MADDGERPRVADLKKLFGGQSKAQTPADFAQQQQQKPSGRHPLTRSQAAAAHNQKLRRQSLQQPQQPSTSTTDLRNDPRLADLSPAELDALVSRTPHHDNEDLTLALHDILDYDVVTGDALIDQMSISALLGHLHESSDTHRVGDMRTKLFAQTHTSSSNASSSSASSKELSNALAQGTERDINRAILRMFFTEFDASRLGDIDSLLDEYADGAREDELFADIAWRYPDHANRLVTFSIYASYEADDEYTSSSSSEEEEEQEEGGKAQQQKSARRRPSYVLSALC